MNTASPELVTMDQRHWQVLRPVLIESGCGLLEHYGVTAQAAISQSEDSERLHIAGVPRVFR